MKTTTITRGALPGMSGRALIMGSAAGITLAMFMSVSTANAQAAVTLDLSSSAFATADIDAVLSQSNPGDISAVASGSTMAINVTTPGDAATLITTTLSSVTGVLEDNLFTASATANTSDSSVVLNVTPTFADDTVAVGTSQNNIGDVDAVLLGNTHEVMISGDTSTVVDGELIFVGTLIVDNNDMSASATSNNAVASIAIAGGVSLAGTGNGAEALTDLNGANNFSGSADLVVATSQLTNDTITATIQRTLNESGVYVNVETVSGATVTLTGSDITASASANVLKGALDATDSTTNSVGASVAMAGLQLLNDDVIAQIDDTEVELIAGLQNDGNSDGYINASTLTLDSNTITASATGNNSTQAVALTANSLVGDINSATSEDTTAVTAIRDAIELRVAADAVVTNYQVQTGNYEVLADVNGARISLNAYDDGSNVDNSTLNLTANRIGTQAVGAVASTGLTLSANAIDATGAVASVQSNLNDVIATTTDARIQAYVDTDVSGSTATVTGNRITALASGVQAASTLTIASGTNNLTIAANTGDVSIDAAPGVGDLTQPTVEAGYVVTNDQASTGTTSALVEDGFISLFLEDDTSGSVQTLDSNVLSATAYGQTASNAIDLSFNNLLGTAASATAATPVLAATANAQSMSGATVTAEVYGYASGNENTPIFNFLDDEIFGGASYSTSSNVVSATVVGNRTLDNSLTVAPTNLIMAGGSQTGSIAIYGADISAAGQLMVTSLQEADGVTLTASQNDGGDSNQIMTQLDTGGDTIYTSTLVSDNNLMTVSTTANSAVNDIALGGTATTEVGVSSVLISSQMVEATTMVSELGIEGTPTIDSYTSANASAVSALSTIQPTGSVFLNNGLSPVVFNFGTPLTTEEQAILVAAGLTVTGPTTAELAPNATMNPTGLLGFTYSSGSDTFPNSNDETLTITAFNSVGSTGTPNNAGVFIATGDYVSGSTVSVNGNTLASAIMGNEAVNTLVADATTMGTVIASPAGGVYGAGAAIANADSVLINRQEVDTNTTSDSSVYGTFAFDQSSDRTVSGSTITIDSNMIEASATNNSAANAVVLTATNADTTAALANMQSSDGDVATISDMEVFTNVETIASTVSMSDNANRSLASVNTASNRVSLTATNIDSVNGGNASATYGGGITTGADLSINSDQYAGGPNGSSALANTTIYNEDQVDTTVGSIDSSTYAMNDNATVSQSTVNSVNNVLMVGSAGTANNDATAGLNNLQTSLTTSDATSTSAITLDMTSASLDSIIDSTVSLDGNTTTARATGNNATNALNAAGANITAGTGADAAVNLFSNTVAASYYVGSVQLSTASVTATSTATTTAELASNTTALEGSTLSLDGNAVAAYATANMVSNSVLNMGGEDTATLDATGAVSNYQNSTGIVTASATNDVNATFDTFSTTTPVDAALNGSTLSIQNNSTVAMARGNVASNSLNASAVNATVGNGLAAINSVAGTTTASYALVNSQLNQATIDAISNGASYGATLNGAALTSGETALASSMLSISGNSVQAVGYGNIATNSVTLASLNSSSNDATAALFSTQNNTGAVNVMARNASIGYSSLGALTNATFSVGGNTVSASAVGNLATSRITRN